MYLKLLKHLEKMFIVDDLLWDTSANLLFFFLLKDLKRNNISIAYTFLGTRVARKYLKTVDFTKTMCTFDNLTNSISCAFPCYMTVTSLHYDGCSEKSAKNRII